MSSTSTLDPNGRKVRRKKGRAKSGFESRPRLQAEVPAHLGLDKPRRRPSFY